MKFLLFFPLVLIFISPHVLLAEEPLSLSEAKALGSLYKKPIMIYFMTPS